MFGADHHSPVVIAGRETGWHLGSGIVSVCRSNPVRHGFFANDPNCTQWLVDELLQSGERHQRHERIKLPGLVTPDLSTPGHKSARNSPIFIPTRIMFAGRERPPA